MLVYRIKRFARKMKARLRMLAFAINPPKKPDTNNGPLLVHIGCGNVYHPDFVNVDARNFPHVHHVTDNLFKLDMFGNAQADLIYMCHLFEHVKREERENVLREMQRVLKPGGVLRISVPDFDKLLAIYNDNGQDMRTIEDPLMGAQTYDYNYHYSAFNKALLSDLLLSAGFSTVREWDPATAKHYAPIEDWAKKPVLIGETLYPISLNLEGVK